MKPARPSLLLALLATSCASTSGVAPSLAPRPAEAIDPRLPVADQSASIPADQALATQIDTLVAQAEAATSGFADAIARAEQLATSAGAAQSESWIAAQEALSAAVAARYPVTRALGDLDALSAARVRERGGLTRADQQLFDAASRRIGLIDQNQAEQVGRVQRRLRT